MKRTSNRQNLKASRSGTIAVLAAISLVGLLAIVALAVDVGMLHVSRVELQRTADASAMAAAWDLMDQESMGGSSSPSETESAARLTAAEYASLNPVFGSAIALSESDVQVGFLADPFNRDEILDMSGANPPNAVRVRVRRDGEVNDSIPLFFAKVLGWDSATVEADATACMLSSVGGFTVSERGGNLAMLPMALDQDTWNDLLAGNTDDNWTWNGDSETVTQGSDGILECNLYPQGTNSPGNRGTVDIGSSNNSTADISRQITDGVSQDDLDHHGGALTFDENGVITLNGDTGISAGVKDELASIKGLPRVIPIFSQVSGNGNNANYTIVKFVGVRIMEVKLTGPMKNKRVIVQPANVVIEGAMYTTTTGTSDFIVTPAWLIR